MTISVYKIKQVYRYVILTKRLIKQTHVNRAMKRWMHKIEVLVDKAIGPCIIILLAVIIMELGFHDMVEHYQLETHILIADYLVIFIFVLDLIFKYLKTKHLKDFFRKYWLDILAVFPFFLMFRFYEITIGIFTPALAEGAETAQKLIHEGLEVEKEGVKIIRESEKIAKEASELSKVGREASEVSKISREASEISKVSRTGRLARFLRPIFRIPRLFKSAHHTTKFFAQPDGSHHEHEYMPRHNRKS